MPHKTAVLYPPCFDERISCPALIMGKSHDSGHNTGLDAIAKRREIPERFVGEIEGVSQNRDQG